MRCRIPGRSCGTGGTISGAGSTGGVPPGPPRGQAARPRRQARAAVPRRSIPRRRELPPRARRPPGAEREQAAVRPVRAAGRPQAAEPTFRLQDGAAAQAVREPAAWPPQPTRTPRTSRTRWPASPRGPPGRSASIRIPARGGCRVRPTHRTPPVAHTPVPHRGQAPAEPRRARTPGHRARPPARAAGRRGPRRSRPAPAPRVPSRPWRTPSSASRPDLPR